MSEIVTLAPTHAAKSAHSLLKDLAPLAGRILLATLFILSGVEKLGAQAQTAGYIASVGLPFPEFLLGLAIAVELGGGVNLLFGFQARWAACFLAGFTLVAGAIFHADFGDPNQMIHFLKNLSIIGGLLQVAGFGGGRFSLDQLLRP